MEFKRSTSKVWWASESVEWREISDSPQSQDSGFSDAETDKRSDKDKSNVAVQAHLLFQKIPSVEKPQNLLINWRDKCTSDKNMSCLNPKTNALFIAKKTSPKPVNRNLFDIPNTVSVKDVCNHQYSKDTTQSYNSSEPMCTHSCYSCATVHSFHNNINFSFSDNLKVLSKTAPAILQESRNEDKPREHHSFNENNSLSSDCESELECLFNGPIDSPAHTSTPKASLMNPLRRNRNKLLPNHHHTHIQDSEQPTEAVVLTDPIKRWIESVRQQYENECMTTLQSKSIANELNQKVFNAATHTMLNITILLNHSFCIQTEYKKLNSEGKLIEQLSQSLAGKILAFFRKYSDLVDNSISEIYEKIRKAKERKALKLVLDLFNIWQTAYYVMVNEEIKKLVSKLETPYSELELRATVTGITSLLLRNENLVNMFLKNDILPILLILCEKCEGSSMRSLIFRALSTVCQDSSSVRQFEKYSGVQIISDTLQDDASRPEPERSEAVALLTQVTAPWIEDNHCIKGLHEYSRTLIRSISTFASTTKCCQNLLLCTAALANLSTMDQKCISHMMHFNSVQTVLQACKIRGPYASTYLWEQVATILANMTSLEVARKHLLNMKVIKVLLNFLSIISSEEVGKRLQQKSIIALSRLCSEPEAAMQVFEAKGLKILIKLCKEKNERYNNDAVLVATLATLRKITETCGSDVDVISVEDAQELITPKLLDSFLAYSNQSESYV